MNTNVLWDIRNLPGIRSRDCYRYVIVIVITISIGELIRSSINLLDYVSLEVEGTTIHRWRKSSTW